MMWHNVHRYGVIEYIVVYIGGVVYKYGSTILQRLKNSTLHLLLAIVWFCYNDLSDYKAIVRYCKAIISDCKQT